MKWSDKIVATSWNKQLQLSRNVNVSRYFILHLCTSYKVTQWIFETRFWLCSRMKNYLTVGEISKLSTVYYCASVTCATDWLRRPSFVGLTSWHSPKLIIVHLIPRHAGDVYRRMICDIGGIYNRIGDVQCWTTDLWNARTKQFIFAKQIFVTTAALGLHTRMTVALFINLLSANIIIVVIGWAQNAVLIILWTWTSDQRLVPDLPIESHNIHNSLPLTWTYRNPLHLHWEHLKALKSWRLAV